MRQITTLGIDTAKQVFPHSSGFSGSEVQPRTDSLPKSGFAG